MKKLLVLLLIVGMFLLTGCESEEAAVQRILNETATAEAIADLTQAPILATQHAEQEATAEVENATASAIASQEAQQTTMALARTVTAEAQRAQATADAGAMLADIQELAELGYLESTDGYYQTLRPYTESKAMINYIGFEPTRIDAINYVIRGHISAAMDGEAGNAFNSGCGFAFRISEEGDYYLIVQAMDGNVYLHKTVPGTNRLSRVDGRYAGQIGFPNAEFDFIFIVEGPSFRWFVNGEYIAQFYHSAFPEGELAYAMVSGTNIGFGTRCTMTNVEAWILDE